MNRQLRDHADQIVRRGTPSGAGDRSAEFAGEPVEEDRRGDRLPDAGFPGTDHVRSGQGGEHAGKDIAASRCGQGGAAGKIPGESAVGGGNNRVRTFGDNDGSGEAGEKACIRSGVSASLLLE